LRVKEITNEKYPFIYDDELATKARAIIRDFDIRILPVTDGNQKVLAMVSRGDLMAISSSISPIRVKGIMTNPKHMVTMDDAAVSTVKEMIRLDEWYVPVVNSPQDRIYKGVLALEDFIEFSIKTSPEKLVKLVSEIMSKNVVACSPEDEIDNMRALGAIPVVENKRLVGIITERDFFKIIE
jgi:CBS domain-containing protein